MASIRCALIGLVAFAAAEDEMLLEAVGRSAEAGTPSNWAAVPVVAHNTDFKAQQVERLRSVAAGRTPPEFPDIEHTSEELYSGYASVSADVATSRCRSTTGDLVDALAVVSDEDLSDPSRQPWLRGRALWLQVVVRSFWHPTGHIAEYYLTHGNPERAVTMQAHAVATAKYLSAPPPAQGMAAYNLACAAARAGLHDRALTSLASAVDLNDDLAGKARSDPDLAVLRADGRLDDVLGPEDGRRASAP